MYLRAEESTIWHSVDNIEAFTTVLARVSLTGYVEFRATVSNPTITTETLRHERTRHVTEGTISTGIPNITQINDVLHKIRVTLSATSPTF